MERERERKTGDTQNRESTQESNEGKSQMTVAHQTWREITSGLSRKSLGGKELEQRETAKI